MKPIIRVLSIYLFLLPILVLAKGVYQTDSDFLGEVFSGQPPTAKVLWLSGDLKSNVAEIIGHPYNKLRVKFWQKGQRTVWILEEIGKEKPITTGIVVEQGEIRKVKVLAFRESRGWEIKHAFFTNQFEGAFLKESNRLDRHIDGITGATLSVRAVTKLSRLALYLNHYVEKQAAV